MERIYLEKDIRICVSFRLHIELKLGLRVFSSEELIACSAMDFSTFDERLEAPGRSTKLLILVWSLVQPLAPKHVFLAPAVSARQPRSERPAG